MKKFKLFLFAAVLLGSVGLQAGNTITYTATAKQSGYYDNLDVGKTTFGPAIISHEFSYGIGTITCDGEITKIGERAFYSCSDLTSITIPNSVTTIGSYAFYYCPKLTSITIPNSVTTIGNDAFYYCIGLTSITIPKSVITIGELAFSFCSDLTSVKVFWTDKKSIPSIDSNVFNKIAHDFGPAEAKLYVPKGTAALYQQTDVWKDFGSMIEDVKIDTITYYATARLSGYNGSLNEGATTFGPAIISHTFSNGIGTITCDGEITKIGERAFYLCSDLTSITIPKSVTTIESYAFYQCSNLPSITIGNSVTTIGERAFYKCGGLTSIEIPYSVTTIGDYAFEGCDGLTSIEIPYSVTTIGNAAFYYCSSLTSVMVFWTDKKSIPSINSNVFGGIAHSFGPAGAKLYVPKGTAALYQQTDGWKDFGSMIEDVKIDTITYYATAKLSGYNGSLNVGATTFGPAIISHTFSNGIGTIICDGEITTIGEETFFACSSLSSIEIPNSVTTIGSSAFSGCSDLTLVAVFWTDKKSIPSINSNVFGGIAHGSGPAEAKLYVPKGTAALYQQTDGWKDFGSIIEDNIGVITYTATSKLLGHNGSLNVGATTFGPAIISHEFSNGTGTIICDGEITTIGKETFFACSSLSSIEIPNSVTTIGDDAFYDCSGLTSIEIPYSVTTIGNAAFNNCSGLTSITIPNSVTTIGDYAFEFCDGLTSVTIGNSITTIGKYTFCLCSNLTSIIIGNSVTTIGNAAFEYCSSLPSVTIPNSVTTIGNEAFEYCDGLTSVTIGNSVTTIGSSAFSGCSGLTSITIPHSVTRIGDDAFYDCSGLTSVTVFWTDKKSIPSINSNVFGGIAHSSGPAEAKLYVPKGTKELYQQADVWKKFDGIESDIVIINNLWYRLLNARTANLIANQDTTTGERIPYSGDVVIPKTAGLYNIATIEDSAFYNAKLTSLTVLTDFPLPCSEHTFMGQDKSIPLYVLDVPAFQSAKYWKEFTNILFYQPYKEEAKKKVQDIVNGIPSQYASQAKPIADNYFQDIENVNTIRQVDDLTTQALTKLQVFYDQGLWIKSGDYWLLKGKELLK